MRFCIRTVLSKQKRQSIDGIPYIKTILNFPVFQNWQDKVRPCIPVNKYFLCDKKCECLAIYIKQFIYVINLHCCNSYAVNHSLFHGNFYIIKWVVVVEQSEIQEICISFQRKSLLDFENRASFFNTFRVFAYWY